MANTYSLAGHLSDLIGAARPLGVALYVVSSEPALTDNSINKTRLGTQRIPIAPDGSWSVLLWGTNDVDIIPVPAAGETRKYQVAIKYVDPVAGPVTFTTGWFDFTSDLEFWQIDQRALTQVDQTFVDDVLGRALDAADAAQASAASAGQQADDAASSAALAQQRRHAAEDAADVATTAAGSAAGSAVLAQQAADVFDPLPELARNRHINPRAVGTNGYGTVNGGTVTAFGNGSVRFTGDGAGTYLNLGGYPVTPGQMVTASVERVASSTPRFGIGVLVFRGPNNLVEVRYLQEGELAPGRMGRLVVQAAAVPGAASVDVWVAFGANPAQGETHDFRRPMVSIGETVASSFAQQDPAYFDGTSAGCRWLGAPDASASIKALYDADDALRADRAPELARNLIPRGTFYAGTSPWLAPEGGVLSVNGSRLRLTAGPNSAGTYMTARLLNYVIPAAPGETFTIRARVRQDSTAPTTLRLSPIRTDGSIAYAESLELTAATTGAGGKVLTGSYVVPAGKTGLTGDVYHFIEANGQFFELDEVQLHRSSATPPPYFDGSSPGARWVGAPHASPSIKMLPSKADDDLLVWLDAGRAQGVGSPEGRVPAPVGAEYRDTSAQNGAVKWIKAAGDGGPTGWRVAWGDTGYRRLNTLLDPRVAASDGYLNYVRRIGDMVTMGVIFENAAEIGGNTIFPLFTQDLIGFRGDSLGPESDFTAVDAATTGVYLFQRGGQSRSGYPYAYFATPKAAGQAKTRGTYRYLTPDPWPATLPGTPV